MIIRELRETALKFYKKNNIKKAIDLYRKILEIEAGDWTLHWDIAYLFSKEKRYHDAIVHYQKANKILPKNKAILNELGTSLFFGERYLEAKECFDLILSLNSLDFEAWNNLGTIHIALEEYNQGILCYEKALRINPFDEKTKENREYARQKQLEKQLEKIIWEMKEEFLSN